VGIDWRWIFVINLPIGLATLIGGARILPEVRAERGSRLPDGISALLLLAAVTLVVLSTVQGPSWGWTAPGTLTLFAAAAVSIVLTVLRTLRHPHALIERNLFESRPFTAATVAIFAYFIGFAVILLSAVLFLQDQWHYGAVRAGLAIAPGPAMSALFAVNAGRLTKRFGRTIPASIGAACMVIGAITWTLSTGSHPEFATEFLPGMLVSGVSAGLIQAPLFAASGTLPPERATTGSAVLTTARQIGSAFGVAVVVVVLGNGATHATSQYHHVWIAEACAGVLAGAAVIAGASRSARASVVAPVQGPSVAD
jgi:MFS family permease